MLIIEINSADGKFHHFQSQSHRTECWLDRYIEVPKELETKVYESGGYCELIIKDNILIDVVSHPEWVPDFLISEIGTEPTNIEQLRADVDYIALMTGVEL